MKKIFMVLSVVALVAFMAGPSSALIGMPDDVPGTDILLPFFIVSIDGAPDNRGDNTLVTITEVKGAGGYLHVTILDKKSRHVGDFDIPYTPYDVIPLSLYDIISTKVGAGGIEDLEVDLDSNGVMDHYMGYVTFENFVYKTVCNTTTGCDTKVRVYPDNLIGHTYVIDLLRGQASGNSIPAREYAPRDARPWDCEGWQYTQNTSLGLPYFGGVGYLPWPEFTDFEVYTGLALLTSKLREQGWCEWLPFVDEPLPEIGEMIGVPSYFSLLPRYYLFDANATNHIFVWTSGNWGSFNDGGQFDPDRYNVIIDIFDEKEVWTSGQINLPWEVNFVDVKRILPAAWLPGPAIGGWLNIRWEFECVEGLTQGGFFDQYPWLYSAIPLASEWLAYSWQRADGSIPGLNWSVLFQVHRDVGTWTDLLCDLVDIN